MHKGLVLSIFTWIMLVSQHLHATSNIFDANGEILGSTGIDVNCIIRYSANQDAKLQENSKNLKVTEKLLDCQRNTLISMCGHRGYSSVIFPKDASRQTKGSLGPNPLRITVFDKSELVRKKREAAWGDEVAALRVPKPLYIAADGDAQCYGRLEGFFQSKDAKGSPKELDNHKVDAQAALEKAGEIAKQPIDPLDAAK